MTQDDLSKLSKDELIELALSEYAELQALKVENEALKLKLEKNRKPPTNSRNSSQPPSQDQKSNRPKDKRKKRHGPPLGHVKYERTMIANPNRVVDVKPQVCAACQANLSATPGQVKDVNQITELPEAKAEVIEVRQMEVECPCCGQKQTGEPPEGLEMERAFGARLEATVVYYRQEQHMSYERTRKTLADLHGVKLCEGSIDKIMQKAGKEAKKQSQPIAETVRTSQVIHCDETGSRVEAQNWWQWVFVTTQAVLHVARFDRSVDVIQEVMAGQEAEVWVSDVFSAQMKAPAKTRQLCMAHQLRNLQAVIEEYPQAFWPKAMQILFRAAVHLHNERDQLPPEKVEARVQRLERLCDGLLERPRERPEEKRLLKRYRKYRDSLFVFLHRNDVPPTNNVSERYLRPSVIHRKVMGCFRSSWGVEAYAAIASVIHTAGLQGRSALDAIQGLFGKPSLPLPPVV